MHMVQLGTGRRVPAGEGQRCVTLQPRVAASIRRECLDHVIILNQRHLRCVLHAYLAYYHRSRTHLAVGKDAPESRPASSGAGTIVVTPEVGGLHHRYNRCAA